MRKMILALSVLAMMVGVTGCKFDENSSACQAGNERQFLTDAIKNKSQDVQTVELNGNTVVYTHIFDGIVDIKTYEFEDDTCVEVERVYVFPDQMSALRHYRRAIEQAELYDDIQLFNNKVKYDLKQAQHELETKGLTPEQLKAKFEKQIAAAKADLDQKCKSKCK